ncbi:hypothetical protein [Labrys monachus]|uniref:Uncharacterized protein n=1 Tax=Labrys monachus TaxID=217067 RepID=A0ABU0FBF0_9HYPH|nr:hypothetical protein [Labrys monachus]MDQ0391454.1 hypothetical protein [Labrys monachus]
MKKKIGSVSAKAKAMRCQSIERSRIFACGVFIPWEIPGGRSRKDAAGSARGPFARNYLQPSRKSDHRPQESSGHSPIVWGSTPRNASRFRITARSRRRAATASLSAENHVLLPHPAVVMIERFSPADPAVSRPAARRLLAGGGAAVPSGLAGDGPFGIAVYSASAFAIPQAAGAGAPAGHFPNSTGRNFSPPDLKLDYVKRHSGMQ